VLCADADTSLGSRAAIHILAGVVWKGSEKSLREDFWLFSDANLPLRYDCSLHVTSHITGPRVTGAGLEEKSNTYCLRGMVTVCAAARVATMHVHVFLLVLLKWRFDMMEAAGNVTLVCVTCISDSLLF